jgi:hypothetical protein
MTRRWKWTIAGVSLSLAGLSVAGILLLLLLAAVAVPVLGVSVFMANRFASVFLAPPYMWEFTRHPVAERDLIGEYRVEQSDPYLPGRASRFAAARVTLLPDHTARVEHLPSFDLWGKGRNCDLSGDGSWRILQLSDQRVHVRTTRPTESPQACAGEVSGSPLKQSPPYDLYVSVGDPDQGIGYRLVRTSAP